MTSVTVFLSLDNFTIIMGLFVAIMFGPPDTPGYSAAIGDAFTSENGFVSALLIGLPS
jgi:vacuolar-type H+-ATPase subunit I/STV1